MARHAKSDEERQVTDGDWGPFHEAVYRASNRAQRAGWIVRKGGRWTILDPGRSALTHYLDAKTLYDKARTAELDGDGLPDSEDDRLPYIGEINDWGTLPATVFKQGTASVEFLVAAVDSGAYALPDIQRPFVWESVKVRDLFDSMFRGFPIGYLLLWDNPILSGKDVGEGRVIGTGAKGTNTAKSLIIDGQQRLTSLYAVMTGTTVLDHAFRARHIQIGFHPLEARFEVADAAILKNPEWIADISGLFKNPAGMLQLVRTYLERLKASRAVTQDHEATAMGNLSRLAALKQYTLGTLEIASDADEEQVAEIFVRVNSKGQNLKQADFILTLLSVYWEDGRQQLEDFARGCREPEANVSSPSPFNQLLQPAPEDLLRVVIAVSHRRARLRSAYQVLRGRDPESNRVTVAARTANIEFLREAQPRVLDLSTWHDFLTCLRMAGYRAPGTLPSINPALYAYAFFLLGREQYGMPKPELRRLIARFYLMAIITDRYTSGSPESVMESDLARLRPLKKGDAAGFTRIFDDLMASELTRDFWDVTLPARFETSSQRTMSSFLASLCILEARALFSQTGLSVEKLLDPESKGTRKDLEIHHLFPKAWLKDNGFDEPRQYNQIANLTPIEYEVNLEIGAQSPTQYAPKLALASRHGTGDTARMHAMPAQWWEMSYPDFLVARRKLMAGIVRAGFDSLARLSA